MKPKKTGGGWAAVMYTLRMANKVGWRRLWQAMRAKETLWAGRKKEDNG